jgi:transaldolase
VKARPAPFVAAGEVDGLLSRDGGHASETLVAIVKAGVDIGVLAADLQSEGAKSFDDSWNDLLETIETKSNALA